MKVKKTWFINPDENRLRAGWRIAAFFAIMMPTAFLLNKLIRVIFGGIPGEKYSWIWWTPRSFLVIISATIAVWVTRKFIDKKTFKSLGLKLNSLAIKDFLFGMFLSGFMVGIIFLFLLWTNMLEVTKVSWTDIGYPVFFEIFMWFFVVGASVAWSEDLIFRGYLLQNMIEGMGMKLAIIISCIFYGVVHMANPNASILSGTLIAIIGYLRIFGWLRTSQLWLTMGMHAGWNFFQGPIFGFEVSGMGSQSLINHNLSGSEWITGATFGPEAGIPVIPAVILGLLIMYLWTNKREDTPWIQEKTKTNSPNKP